MIDRRMALAAFAAMTLCSASAHAATAWPTRQVTIMVPTGAGGTTDMMARLAAQQMARKCGQPIVVGGKPGAGSQVVAGKRSLGGNTIADFIAYAKAHPGKLNFAAAGTHNISDLAPMLLFKQTGVNVVMVPSRGEPQAITDQKAGNVDFYFGNTSVLLAQKDDPALKLIAVGTAKRVPAAPDLPTVGETVPGFSFASWNGFMVPAGTPNDVVDKLRNEVAAFVKTPEMQQRLTKLGIIPGGESKEEVAATFAHDRKAFADAVAAAGIPKP